MLVLLSALLATASAQSDTNNYGTVAFIRTGERTPWLRSGPQILTALGAHQMLELGHNFRGRYIDAASGATRMGILPIAGISQDAVNPEQLLVQTLDQPFLVAAAQAFMQGLYPPSPLNSTRVGPQADAAGLLGNGTAVDYPLGVYQYAGVGSVGSSDPASVNVSGHDACPSAMLQSALYEITPEFLGTQEAESAFYQGLNDGWFGGDVPQGMLDYMNAYGIYDALSYHYVHDASTYSALSNGNNSGVLDKVRYLANQDAWYRYGNVTSDTDPTSAQRAIAGRTLASLILGQFQAVIENEGNVENGFTQPLTLLFGEYDPMISFFSVAEVDYYLHQTTAWQAIPEYASALIFELYTRGNDTPSSASNFWVRFSYHNGTADYDDTAPQAYPIFRNGPSNTEMLWSDFQSSMSAIALGDLSAYCDQCASTALFCTGADPLTIALLAPGKTAHPKISPVVGGVIGGVVTLVVAGLAFGVAMLVGGIRFHRVQRRRTSSLGGFKGSAKLASDADLTLAGNGSAPAGVVGGVGGGDGKDGTGKRGIHERVGSWELRQKETGGGGGEESRRASFEAIEAAMERPVEPVERV